MCDFCGTEDAFNAERHGSKLRLGSAEIRVFSSTGLIYAAPTLLYHYMSVHNYLPPKDFLDAVNIGARPPDIEYFDKLENIELEWNKTYIPAE